MNRNRLFGSAGIGDLIALSVIALLGLFIAYVTFGILESQAQAEIQKYSVSGALAGALVTSTLLASVYLQLRKSSGEVESLRRRIDELQYKVIRGAPCPSGFETDVNERNRIVLARPEKWRAKHGILLNLESREVTLDNNDIFPTLFTVYYEPTGATPDPETFYKSILKEWETSPVVISPISEYVFVGGEQGAVKSLKIAAKQFVSVELIKRSPITGKLEWDYQSITEEEYNSNKDKPAEDTGDPNVLVRYFPVVRMWVSCYHVQLKGIFSFVFVDNVEDFTQASTALNQILNSVRFLT